LADILSRYGECYPNVRLELNTTSAIVDLGREKYDVALRVGQLASSTLVSVRLGSVNAGYFASPKYLEKRGMPTIEGIVEHAAISTRGQGQEMWPFWVNGREKRVLITPHVVVDDCTMAVRAARSALGIVYAPFDCAGDAVGSGDLQQVLIEATPPALPISAVFTAGASGVPRVAALLDMLKEWFQAHGRQI
jgi:DNA-binding transcriptional LysR family regulator